MWPVIIPFVGLAIWLLSGDDNELSIELNSKAKNNCSEEFVKLSTSLDLKPNKSSRLKQTRKVIEEKVRTFFREKKATSFLGFYIQGSMKHKTIIRKHNDTCDVDLGVYLAKKPDITPATLQKNIAGLLTNQTIEGTEIRAKCVRVFYANKSYIDLPIYYKDNKQNKFYIAVGTNNVWEEDDPKLFTEWLKRETANEQKIRLIKFFKAWADNYKVLHSRKMPPGIALTIWAIAFFESDARDDIAFVKTAHKLYLALSKTSFDKWECKMPTTPFDNVIRKLNDDQRKNFLQALKELLEEVNRIFKSDSKEECINKWQGIFGKFFRV